MPSFYTLPTALGEAKIANAIALGTQVNISELAVGDGGGSLPTPDSDRTALVNELRRAPINRIEVDDENPNWIVVEQILPPDVGGWTVRELGLLDNDGNLIAYGNYPETYKPVLSEGSGRTQTIRFVMQVSDTAAVTLKVDPSVVLATREYVDDLTQIADQAEVNDGTDDTKIVTSKKLKNWSKQATETVMGLLTVATQDQVDAGSDDATAVTPKKMRWGVSYSIAVNGYLILPSWLGGLVFQWGRTSVDGGNVTEVDLQIPFPGSFFTILGSDVLSSPLSDMESVASPIFHVKNNASFEVVLNANSTNPNLFSWFALGV